ncbi:MAG: ABC transporter ATP-binding protein [Gemmobacter sp.]
MTALLSMRDIHRRFAPPLTLGDRIAARLGAGVDTRAVRAVDGVSLDIARGEVLGLVGESGCGKSTLGRIAAGILPPSSGTVTLDGAPVWQGGRKRTTRVQTIFQDPFASLDPRMRVGETIAEGPLAHGLVTRAGARAFVAGWLTRVGLDAAYADRLPHQFSGGQRQRIAIARALAMQPDLVICDEPVASLDVSIQAQIINLFLRLRRELGLTMLFISHDLSVVRHIADRIAVMYLGRIVETGPTAQVYAAPCHPYSRALLASVPQLTLADDAVVRFTTITGEIPSPLAPPPGCHFHPRCPIAEPRCRASVPPLRAMGDGRQAACFLARPPG